MTSVAHRLRLCTLGADVDVDCLGPRAAELHDELARRWSLCARDDAGPTPPTASTRTTARIEVALGAGPGTAGEVVPGVPRIGGEDLGPVLVSLTQAVTHAAIAANVGRLLMFHAAALSNQRTGAAVVLVAPGGTGKTTAARTLGRGRGYLTDETVGVTDDDRIVGYAKPLSVRRPGSEVKDELDPLACGLRPPRVTAYARAVLLLDRDETGPDVATVQRLDLLSALTDLVPETSSLAKLLPRPLHRLHGLLERVDLVARVHYRDATGLEPLLTELIGAPEPPSDPQTEPGSPR